MAARPLVYKVARLHGCLVAQLQGCTATRFRGRMAAGLQGYVDTHGCRATWLNGHAIRGGAAKPIRADVGKKNKKTAIGSVAKKVFGQARRRVNFSSSPDASGAQLGWNL